MSRTKSFIAGFLCCLFGLGLIFLGLTGTFKKFFRIFLEEYNQPANTTTHNTPNQHNPANNKTMISTNNGISTDNIVDIPTQPQSINPNAFVLPKNKPSGTLMSVHGIGGSHLTSIPSQYTQKREQIHKNVLNPTLALIHAAQKDGIHLSIVSAFRPYNHQKSIWERKWGNAPDDDINKAKEILRFSSFPGTSRHHWGTDIDFNSVNPSYWETQEGRRTHNWLKQNAPKYGFCQTYVPGRSGGYNDEAWHWSHMPTAQSYYAQITNPEIFQIALNQNIKGSQAVNRINTLISYITSISSCNYSSTPVAPTPHISQKKPK